MAIRAPGSYVTAKKGAKKSKSRKNENRFGKKKFFNLKTNIPFPVNQHGTTCVTRIRAKMDLKPLLVKRTFSVNQGDLEGENTSGSTFRLFNFKIGDVRGDDCHGYFNGMELSQWKMSSFIRKWHTLVEADTVFTTADGSKWRIFVSGVTKKLPGDTGKTHYLQSSQVRHIRSIMNNVVIDEVENVNIDELIRKLSTDTISKEMESRCASVYPMGVLVRKIKPINNLQVIEVETLKKEHHVEEIAI